VKRRRGGGWGLPSGVVRRTIQALGEKGKLEGLIDCARMLQEGRTGGTGGQSKGAGKDKEPREGKAKNAAAKGIIFENGR